MANDIVAKSYSQNQKAGVALSNVSLTTDQYILLVTNEDLAGDGIVNGMVNKTWTFENSVLATISVDNIDVAPLPQIGELQIFTLTPKKAGKYNIPVAFSKSGLAQMVVSSTFEIIQFFVLLGKRDFAGEFCKQWYY